jgi:hypothetical protein
MAQQPYMGSGLLFPRILGRAHSWQLVTGDRLAVRRLGWEMEALNLAYETFLFMPVRFFYMP